ncbi:MAG: hypothetical protein J5I62_11545 [Flavobacteriales bacterium]|nr:hypothetical protein [Flavobacteriales bacterium]MEB2341651.1 hypothetical protein [Flavobacteriia bacterium]
MPGRLLFAGALVLLAACSGKPDRTDVPEEDPRSTHCYLRHADGLSIRLDRIGDLVNGVMEGPSPDGERVNGTFTGALEGGVFVVLYKYESGGEQKKLEVVLRPVAGGLQPADGERVTIDGITLFKDRGRVHFGALVPEVECP